MLELCAVLFIAQVTRKIIDEERELTTKSDFLNLYPLQVLGNYGILLLCVFLLFEGVTCKFASVKFCFDICCMLWPQVNYICFLVMVPHNCRGQQANNGSLSEEMLAMLYCMAIIR